MRLVVVGTSWGGLHALRTILRDLPADLDAAIAIAQHRRADGTTFVDLLQEVSALPVQEAEDKDRLVPGRVYVAPADYHLLVEAGHVTLSIDERVQFSRPSVDVLFESAADAWGERVVGVVLTGANEDGATGLARVKERGGYAIVQEPGGAERPEMPRAALEATAPDRILALPEIATALVELCRARSTA